MTTAGGVYCHAVSSNEVDGTTKAEVQSKPSLTAVLSQSGPMRPMTSDTRTLKSGPDVVLTLWSGHSHFA